MIGFFALFHLGLFIPFTVFQELVGLVFILLFLMRGVNRGFIKVGSASSALGSFLLEGEDPFTFLDVASRDGLVVLSCMLYPFI